MKTLVVITSYGILWIGLPLLGYLIRLYTMRKKSMPSERSNLQNLCDRHRGDSDLVKLKFEEYVSSVVPSLYDERSTTWQKLIHEVVTNHTYFNVFLEKDSVKAFLKAANILTFFSVLMFLMAVMYDLQFPSDTGVCAAILQE